jgi:hypothetical protein
MLVEILLRLFLGGVLVSAFSALGEVFTPKRFAGLFGAAPSVATATLALTVHYKGTSYAALEARSMIGGALAFLVYASCVSWAESRYKLRAASTTLVLLSVWFAVAFGYWFSVLR